MINPDVFDLAASLLESGGLCKTYLFAHYAPATAKGRRSTVGAIQNACVRLCPTPWTPGSFAHYEQDHLAAFRLHTGVSYVPDVEADKATTTTVADLLRTCGAAYRPTGAPSPYPRTGPSEEATKPTPPVVRRNVDPEPAEATLFG